MPKIVEVPGIGNVEFPDSMNDQDIATQIQRHSPTPRATGQFGENHPILSAPVDALQGIGAGVLSTARGISQLAHKVVPAIPEIPESYATPPESNAAKVGKFAEQAAEFMLPGGAVSKATKAAPVLGRIAAQAGTAAAVAAAQSGGDPKTTAEAALIGGAGEGVGAALNSPLVPRLLRSSAEKQYGQAINATKQGNKWVSQNIAVPELLDRNVSAMTLKGLQKKATTSVDAIGNAINDAWKSLPEGSALELEPTWNAIEKSAGDALTITASNGKQIPVTAQAQNALGNLNYLKQTLLDVAEQNPTSGKLEVPVEKLRQLRQAWDEVAAQAKVYQGQQLADAATGKIHAMAADAIRSHLGQEFPDIAALNKEFSFWKNVEKVVGDTVLRREGQAKPISRQLASAAGATAGAVAGGLHGAILGKQAMDGLQTLTNSTAWKTVSAVQKNKLAQYLAGGNRGGAEFTIRQMLKGVGLEALTPSRSNGQLQPAPVQ